MLTFLVSDEGTSSYGCLHSVWDLELFIDVNRPLFRPRVSYASKLPLPWAITLPPAASMNFSWSSRCS